MLKKLNIKTSIILISIIIVISYLCINLIIDNNKFNNLKMLFSTEQRELIKKYLFFHKHWTYQYKKELKKKKGVVILR